MSAIIGSLIPKIEGFQPIPNAVMIPFMEAQSAALAYGFGLNYEYGKRKIRSMSNDEFNSLTSEQITNMSNEHTHIILSQFQMQVPKVMPMQHEIFKQYVTIEKAKVQQNFELAKWMLSFIKEISDDTLAHIMGGHLHGEILEPPFVTPTDKFINPKTGKQGADAPATQEPSSSQPSPTGKLAPPLTNNLTEAKAFTTWQKSLIDLQQSWIETNQWKILRCDTSGQKQATACTRHTANLKDISSKIKQISNDYRNPNNGIRTAVLDLRQEIANGKWGSK